MRFVIAIIAVLTLCSCSEEQIARAQAVVDQADATQAKVDHAVELAQSAVNIARSLAESTHSAEAAKAVEAAQSALAVAKDGQAVIAESTRAAHLALEATKAASAAGGSTVDVAIAIAGTALPALGALLVTLKRLWTTTRAFRQTVTGISRAREDMPKEVWDEKVAPALSAAQDEDVKARVKAIAPPVKVAA